MGGALDYTTAQMTETLTDAYSRYYDRKTSGGDMVQAGEKLAYAVLRLLEPRPCVPYRDEVIGEPYSPEVEGDVVDLEDLEAHECASRPLDGL